MEPVVILLIILAVITLIVWLVISPRKKKVVETKIPDSTRKLLQEEVEFYQRVSPGRQAEFESRVQHFLSHIRVTGVNTTVEESDKVLVAASAVIPIFGFPDWEYTNINEVLLYPDSFDDEFRQKGQGRATLGMVGNGAFQHVMILSQHELRQAFINKSGKTNTAIHEFVHLVDKSDGSVDGVPESLLPHESILPWIKLMHEEIKAIVQRRSDINPYGATNEAEFFAVVSEYFFERPELLQVKHPDLYKLLSEIFRQNPANVK